MSTFTEIHFPLYPRSNLLALALSAGVPIQSTWPSSEHNTAQRSQPVEQSPVCVVISNQISIPHNLNNQLFCCLDMYREIACGLDVFVSTGRVSLWIPFTR